MFADIIAAAKAAESDEPRLQAREMVCEPAALSLREDIVPY